MNADHCGRIATAQGGRTLERRPLEEAGGVMKRRSSNPQAAGSSSPGPRWTSPGGSCSPSPTIRLGICAMDKKARSKPMREILSRLDPASFETVYFGDDLILNDPVESWPVCDVLIAFYSDGCEFPIRVNSF